MPLAQPEVRTIVRFLFMILAISLCGAVSAIGDNIQPLAVRGPSLRSIAEGESAYARSAPEFVVSSTDNDHAILSRAQSPEPPMANISTTNGENASDKENSRLLRLDRKGKDASSAGASPTANRTTNLFAQLPKGNMTTAAAALAFVVGLFLLFAWFVKRGMPNSSRVLPAEAVQVLGRMPLAARQFGHLLQIGNKLVLVSVSPAGVEKLAEIDDPNEVQRLLALCSSKTKGSSQREFEEVFGQFAKEPAAKGFLGDDAYSSSTGGRQRG